MGNSFKLRIVLSGICEEENGGLLYRFSVLQGLGSLDEEISAVYVQERKDMLYYREELKCRIENLQ